MGLDFSATGYRDKTPSFSYGGFHLFRKAIALSMGIALEEMKGHNTPIIGSPKCPGASWDIISSPLVLLLDHSDCDGHLTPTECRKIAPALKEVLNGDRFQHCCEEDWFLIFYHKGEQLVKMMEHCAKRRVNLVFC
jgi:hypothetical protein